jgi:hypothetical protein
MNCVGEFPGDAGCGEEFVDAEYDVADDSRGKRAGAADDAGYGEWGRAAAYHQAHEPVVRGAEVGGWAVMRLAGDVPE